MNTPSTQSIHAHDIMAILAKTPMKPEALFDVLSGFAGPDPRFHSCSQQNQTFDEILIFLKEREKIQEIDGLLYFTGQSCGH